MRLPNNWYNEFEEYKQTELKGNQGLYDNLTPYQFDAIKAYFRWRTRRRFKELVANTSLSAKPKKAEVLAREMGNAIDWVYDGCVDTGYLGASHCQLGHALRYEHYAISPSTGRELVFGVTCASDFFGIDAEKLKKINTVQDEILEEVKLVVFIMETSKKAEYIQMYYPELMDVINVLRDEMNEAFGTDWNQQMANFLKYGVPWTKSMVDKYAWVRDGRYAKKVAEFKTGAEVVSLAENDSKTIGFIRRNAYQSELHFISTLFEYIALNQSKGGEEINKCKALVKIGIIYEDTVNKLRDMGLNNIAKAATVSKETIYYVKATNGERLATKGEIENKVSALITKDKFHLTEDKFKMLNIFAWGVNGDNKLYKESGCEAGDTEIIKLKKSTRLMAAAINWINSGDAFIKDLKIIIDACSGTEYPNSATDEIEEKSIAYIIDFIYDKCPNNTKTHTLSTALDIAEKAVRYNTYNVSIKQAYVLRNAYEILTYAETEKPEKKEDKPKNNEVVQIVETLLKNKDHPFMAKYSFAYKVLGTVKSQGYEASPKQLGIIKEPYEAFIKHLTEQTNNTDKEEKKDKQNKNNDGYFMDEEDDNYREDTADNEENLFIPGMTKKSDMADSAWKTTSDSIVKMPSILEISQALGSGKFNEGE